VPGYLGRVLAGDGAPVGTCFQVGPRVLVTAWHVLVDADAGQAGDAVAVDGLAPGGAPAAEARVLRVDPVHDLAVLRRAAPLPASVAELARSDEQRIGADVVVTGHAVVPDPGRDAAVGGRAGDVGGRHDAR
jgi:S1-C subfamily serine protease